MAKIVCAIPDFQTKCLFVKLNYGISVGEPTLVTILPKRDKSQFRESLRGTTEPAE